MYVYVVERNYEEHDVFLCVFAELVNAVEYVRNCYEAVYNTECPELVCESGLVTRWYTDYWNGWTITREELR